MLRDAALRRIEWAREAVRFRYRKWVTVPLWNSVGKPYWRRRLQASLEATRPFRVPTLEESDTQVHILVGADQLPEALASLKSCYRFLPLSLPLVVHDDGSLGETERQNIARHFPGAHVTRRRELDECMPALLDAQGLARCAALRRSDFVFASRLFDAVHLAAGRRILQLDSDVLFFERPAELLAMLAAEAADWRDSYNQDVDEGYYAFAPGTIREHLGIDVVPRFNAGLSCYVRDRASWDLFENALALPVIPGHGWFLEQTLSAIESTRRGSKPLPEVYDVCLRYRRQGGRVVSEHYSGASRPAFYPDFVRRVAPALR